MIGPLLALALGIGLRTSGINAAHHNHDGEKVKATVVEVTIEPGQSGLAHRHPGPGFGYVLEG
jgi:quercetin dioxygenase-like cupin family protein